MKKFTVGVWAKDGEFGIRPLDSIQEAQIFLDSWPMERRGPLYYVAANSLKSAEEGAILADDAKSALLNFLSDAEALAEEKLAP